MHYTHIIWDFNGTILDDVGASIAAADDLLSAHGLPTLPSVDAYRAQFGFPVIDYYRRMGFDFEKTPYAVLAPEWLDYYRAHSNTSALYPDIPDTLEAIRARGLSQLILSATKHSMLEEQVRGLGILPYFDELLGIDDIHAAGKEEVGRCWRAAHPDARLLLVGDTDHDAQVARAMEADCILLTAGHQSRERLEQLPVRAIVDTASDVLSFL